MKEINNYLLVHAHALKEDRHTALATVVSVEGPDAGHPGTRALVTPDSFDQRQNKLIACTAPVLGIQPGCKGMVLFEPLEGEGPFWLLEELGRSAKDAVLVTLFSLNPSAPQPGTSLLYREDGILTDLPGDLRHRVMGDVRKAARERVSHFTTYGSLHSFIEFIPARVPTANYQKHVF